MNKTLFISIAVMATGAAQALTVVQWDFNSLPSDNSSSTGTLTPSVNLTSGSIAAHNLTSALTYGSGNSNGGSTDPDATNNDSGLQTTGYAAQGANDKNTGIQVNASTFGYKDIKITWDQRHSNTSSRYAQLQYTTDGVTFVDAPGGLYEGNAGDTWFKGRSYDFTSVAGVNNNPLFGVRIVATFAPSTSGYVASTGSSTYAGTGTYRFDMVTVSGTAVPEPGTMIGLGAAVAAFVARRRSK